jgi:hypothetical protein
MNVPTAPLVLSSAMAGAISHDAYIKSPPPFIHASIHACIASPSVTTILLVAIASV